MRRTMFALLLDLSIVLFAAATVVLLCLGVVEFVKVYL